jgi:hypothetical protein
VPRRARQAVRGVHSSGAGTIGSCPSTLLSPSSCPPPLRAEPQDKLCRPDHIPLTTNLGENELPRHSSTGGINSFRCRTESFLRAVSSRESLRLAVCSTKRSPFSPMPKSHSPNSAVKLALRQSPSCAGRSNNAKTPGNSITERMWAKRRNGFMHSALTCSPNTAAYTRRRQSIIPSAEPRACRERWPRSAVHGLQGRWAATPGGRFAPGPVT